MFRVTILRRIVLLLIIGLFLLQFFGVKVLVGGLTGSSVFLYLKLLDLFAWLESLFASRDFVPDILKAVIPVFVIYLIAGRAFCGWACPMDFLFGLLNRRRDWSESTAVLSKKTGYIIAASFLVLSSVAGIPVFTNYLSQITNFFRTFTGAFYLAVDVPGNIDVMVFSALVLAGLMVLEALYPRLWCRVLCPVGKTYGLLNKISLLRLRFVEGDCGECNLCEQVCPMGVRITPYLDETDLRDTNCIYCGKCVVGCSSKGRLIKMSFLPAPKNKQDK